MKLGKKQKNATKDAMLAILRRQSVETVTGNPTYCIIVCHFIPGPRKQTPVKARQSVQ